MVLPSFQIVKAADDPPIVLNSKLSISCAYGKACIVTSEEGGGTFIKIRGERADVIIQGITFRNASESAVVVSKHAGASVDNGEQMICESNFIG